MSVCVMFKCSCTISRYFGNALTMKGIEILNTAVAARGTWTTAN